MDLHITVIIVSFERNFTAYSWRSRRAWSCDTYEAARWPEWELIVVDISTES